MSFTMPPATSASLWGDTVEGVRIIVYNLNNLRMDIKLLKTYRIHTFSLLESALLVSTITLGVFLSCKPLVVEALAGALIRAASTSRGIWPLLFPLARSLLWAFCSLGAVRFAELLPLESSLTADIFLCRGAVVSSSAGSWFLSLRTCCRRWVSSVWSCFWLIGPWIGADSLCAEDWRSRCCDKPEWGSKEKRKY